MAPRPTPACRVWSSLPLLLAGLALLAAVAPGCARSRAPAAAAADRHVVIVIMDGLRPDVITDAQMPTLAALAREGTRFDNHHSVFPSSTQVNGTALATGQAPATSGIVANRERRPEVELLHAIDTNDPYASWKGDQVYPDGGWVRSPTLPELARARGLTTAVAGTKAVALLWDRSYRQRSTSQPTVFEGMAIPSATLDPIIAKQGPFPHPLDWRYRVNTPRDRWTTQVLTERLWADGVPNLSVLWLYEPDFSQHGTGVGSPNAVLAYKSSDDRLAEVLAALEAKGVRDRTDVIIASDHGFSTVSRKIDPALELRNAGFTAHEAYGENRPIKDGDIVVGGLGGSAALYVHGDEPKRTEVLPRLVRFLQATDWAGVIFTRDGVPGTFKLADAGIDSPQAPDVLVSFRWADEVSQHGTRGTVVCEGRVDKGQGMHVTLSPYDMRGTLIAAGPSFRKRHVSRLPSSNSDVAPTVVRILDLKPRGRMDGRALDEALADDLGVARAAPARPETTTLRAEAAADDAGKAWRQYLRVTTYDGRRYYDEGNAGEAPAPGPR